MQKNMNTSVHHAKLGKPPRMADIMELTKAIIHASYARLAVSLTERPSTGSTHDADGDGGQRKGIADDAADAEGRPLAVAVSVFHFAQRRSAQGAVRGHVSMGAGEGDVERCWRAQRAR